MDTLILDKFSHQSLPKRLFWTTLTIAGWLFWLYLWSPLFLSIGTYLGIVTHISEQDSRFLQQVINTYVNHFLMVTILIGLFVSWSLLQQYRKISQYSEDKINTFKQNTSMNSNFDTPLAWRKTGRIIVIHYDNLGQMV
jgi:poly-beta-1,6-N-acetyl-D-glucosamine biosynthesis protein PgaD